MSKIIKYNNGTQEKITFRDEAEFKWFFQTNLYDDIKIIGVVNA